MIKIDKLQYSSSEFEIYDWSIDLENKVTKLGVSLDSITVVLPLLISVEPLLGLSTIQVTQTTSYEQLRDQLINSWYPQTEIS